MRCRCAIDNLADALQLPGSKPCKPHDSIDPDENVRDNAQRARQARTDPPRIAGKLGRDTALAQEEDVPAERVACAVNPKAAPLVDASGLVDHPQRIRVEEGMTVLSPELAEIGQAEGNVQPAKEEQAGALVTRLSSRGPPDDRSNCQNLQLSTSPTTSMARAEMPAKLECPLHHARILSRFGFNCDACYTRRWRWQWYLCGSHRQQPLLINGKSEANRGGLSSIPAGLSHALLPWGGGNFNVFNRSD